MSVWKHAIYRDAAFQWATRNLPRDSIESDFVKDLLDFDIEPFGDFPVPDGVVPGNAKKNAQNDPKIIYALSTHLAQNASFGLAETIKDLPTALFGLNACYKFVGEFWDRIFRPAPGYDDKPRLANEIFELGAHASYHTASDVVERSIELKALYRKYLDNPRSFIIDLWKTKGYGNTRTARAYAKNANLSRTPFEAVPQKTNTHLKGATIYSYKGTLLIVSPKDNVTYVLNGNDLNRICSIINGVASTKLYVHQYANLAKKEREKFESCVDAYLDIMRKAFIRCNQSTANSVCRAFDVSYNIYLSRLAKDVSDRAEKDQIAKWNREKLNLIMDYTAVLSTVSKLKMKESLEVLLIYKCLPQPDFDYFGAAKRQQDKYQESTIKQQKFRQGNNQIFQNVLLYHKWTMLSAFYAVHKTCPGHVKEDVPENKYRWIPRYPNVTPTDIPFEAMNDIDFNGDFRWKMRTDDNMDLVKDKAICPLRIASVNNAKEFAELPVSAKNQLVDVLTRNTAIDLSELETRRERLFYDVKAEDKPEAKKPNGRWFFEAETDARMKHSEYEDAVAEYAKHAKGCVSGIDVGKKMHIMNAVSDPGTVGTGYRPIFLSFDLEGFSPNLHPNVHKALDEQWAEAFGVPGLNQASRIFTDGNIHYIKGNIHHTFRKMGNDFEGFSGRALTMYHCAVMGYCANQLRKNKLIHAPGRFACLIDDGALRILLEETNFIEDLNNALHLIENIYNHCSLFISWDKTFYSSNFMVFLNEIRYSGRSITPGMRSFVKIVNTAEVICPTITDDLDAIASTARGAITANAPLMAVYAYYAFLAEDTMRKWAGEGKVFKSGIALRGFLPTSLGGLNLQSALLLSGSIGTVGFEEQLGILRYIGMRIPDLRPAINRMLRIPIKPISDVNRAINPILIESRTRTIRSNRMSNLIVKHLSRTVNSPVLRMLVQATNGVSGSLVDTVIHAGCKLPIQIIQSLNAADPATAIRQLANKFLNSRTAQCFVPYWACIRVAFAQKNEAAKWFD